MTLASLDSAPTSSGVSGETWTWWQARRLRYNLTLGAAAWVCYGAAVGLNYAFGHPVWKDWRGGLGMTIFLVVTGVANICYLLGPTLEGSVRPHDVDRYRKTTFAMRFWGSLLVPAIFPLVQFGMLIAHSTGG